MAQAEQADRATEAEGTIFVGKGDEPQYLTLALANRHGLVAGATGTGKTVTLQILAEGLSRAGVPVFAADIKGDLAGIAEVGEAREGFVNRARDIGIDYAPDEFPVVFWTCSASRAIPCAPRRPKWGRCCWRGCSTSTTFRKAFSTSPFASPTSKASCCSTSRICAQCSHSSPRMRRS
jgi:hypothetical protein